MPSQTITPRDWLWIRGFMLLTLCLMLFSSTTALANLWKIINPGVAYMDLQTKLLTPWSHVHVFRIDLTENQMELWLAKTLFKKNATVEDFAVKTNALLAINGGFFDKNDHPLGLRISHQEQQSPLKNISWWGVFYNKENKPYLSSLQHYHPESDIDFAIQSGPRLLVHGRIPPLKPGLAERSALGITPEGQVIIVVTENAPMTTTTLAKFLQHPPLACRDAINLDGGSSSQLYANMKGFKLNVPGFAPVSDAIIIKSRRNS